MYVCMYVGGTPTNKGGQQAKRKRRVYGDHLNAEVCMNDTYLPTYHRLTYLPTQEALLGVSRGLYFRGRLRLNPRNSRAAYISPEGNPFAGIDILIDGAKDR